MANVMVGVQAESELDSAHVDQQRETVRDSLFIQATLSALNGDMVMIGRVRNLSAGGMMVDAPAMPEINEKFGIELRGVGYITGRVAWARDGRVGFAFDTPINPKAARIPVGRVPKVASERKPLRLR